MFLKHIGRQGDRKVAIVFRQIPGEDHMCLVVYPDVLPVSYHDSLMKVIESEPGQQATELSEVLSRNLMPDGRGMLQALHQEGMLKKVSTNSVIVTPNRTSNVRLDELNKVMTEMAQGEAAVKRLAELDSETGLQPKKRVSPTALPRELGAPNNSRAQAAVEPLQAATNSALDDSALAANFATQAAQMEAEARGLLAEAARLKEQAEGLTPKSDFKSEPMAPVKRGPGRPPKVKVLA